MLVEGTSFDAKAMLGDGPKANTGLAIDLAAFSVLGGLIVIGIAERDDGQGDRLIPEPIALNGLKERISQVGTSRVDPLVAVTTRELPTGDGKGYLLVIIPASPAAPHQVDGRYRGRSDTTNYVLTDADVRRLQSERRRAVRDIDRELDDLVGRDPTPANLRANSHLFVVARPQLPTSPTMLHEAVGKNWQAWIRSEIVRKPNWSTFSPDFTGSLPVVERRPDGWAAAHSELQARQVPNGAFESGLLELEIDEDGRLRLFCGRGSDDAQGARVTFEQLIAGLTWRVLRAASVVADKTLYLGNWDLGIALTNTLGMRSHEIGRRSFMSEAKPFAAADYRMTTSATYEELTSHRAVVLERLVGRLNRALNNDGIPLPDFDSF